MPAVHHAFHPLLLHSPRHTTSCHTMSPFFAKLTDQSFSCRLGVWTLLLASAASPAVAASADSNLPPTECRKASRLQHLATSNRISRQYCLTRYSLPHLHGHNASSQEVSQLHTGGPDRQTTHCGLQPPQRPHPAAAAAAAAPGRWSQHC